MLNHITEELDICLESEVATKKLKKLQNLKKNTKKSWTQKCTQIKTEKWPAKLVAGLILYLLTLVKDLDRKFKIIIDKISKTDPIRAACIAAWHLDFLSTVLKLSHHHPMETYDEETSNIKLMLSIFMMFNTVYSSNSMTKSIEEQIHFYTQLKDTIWKDGYKMRNQYFNWLMTLLNNPKDVLKGFSKINFMDQIASFWRFFPRDLLKQTIKKYIDQGIKEGNIETLILTGFDSRCHEVLQSYVDLYGDFQTAALIACHYMRYVKDRDPRVTKWIMEYRKYLSKIRLWNIRCNFDIERVKLVDSYRTHPSYVAEMNGQLKKYEHTIFCPVPLCEMNIGMAHNTEEEKAGLAASVANRNDNGPRVPPSPAVSFSKKIPHCKCMHQLNCSVCGLAMHRINPMYRAQFPVSQQEKSVKKSSSDSSMFPRKQSELPRTSNHLKLDFSEWFSWCNSCKHIGHLEHVEEWFSKHTECPIPDCNCQCKLQCPV
jgi:hypothetical protein